MNRRLIAEGLPLCVIPWPEVRSPLKSEKMGVWPGLKADARMQQLSEEITSTENRIGFARQSYNDEVLEFNN